jgi:hypothetical protein
MAVRQLWIPQSAALHRHELSTCGRWFDLGFRVCCPEACGQGQPPILRSCSVWLHSGMWYSPLPFAPPSRGGRQNGDKLLSYVRCSIVESSVPVVVAPLSVQGIGTRQARSPSAAPPTGGLRKSAICARMRRNMLHSAAEDLVTVGSSRGLPRNTRWKEAISESDVRRHGQPFITARACAGAGRCQTDSDWGSFAASDGTRR